MGNVREEINMGILNSTYIGETLRGGPEKEYNLVGYTHSTLISKKMLTWCSGEIRECHFSTLGQCKWLRGQ